MSIKGQSHCAMENSNNPCNIWLEDADGVSVVEEPNSNQHMVDEQTNSDIAFARQNVWQAGTEQTDEDGTEESSSKESRNVLDIRLKGIWRNEDLTQSFLRWYQHRYSKCSFSEGVLEWTSKLVNLKLTLILNLMEWYLRQGRSDLKWTLRTTTALGDWRSLLGTFSLHDLWWSAREKSVPYQIWKLQLCPTEENRQKRKENIRTGCYQFILYVHCASVFVQDRLKKDESIWSPGDRNVEKGLAENAKAFRKKTIKKKYISGNEKTSWNEKEVSITTAKFGMDQTKNRV